VAVLGGWYDLESLESLHQDEAMRAIMLRMAGLAEGGRLGRFVDEVDSDADLDEETKRTVLELAGERSFLLAFADYSRHCRYLH
jgi:hypothetical protein